MIQENIDELRFQERNGGQGGGAAAGAAGGAAGRDRLMGGKSQAKSRPKPPGQNLDEMDGGVAGLQHSFRQVSSGAVAQGVDVLLDMELESVRQGVRSLGVRQVSGQWAQAR